MFSFHFSTECTTSDTKICRRMDQIQECYFAEEWTKYKSAILLFWRMKKKDIEHFSIYKTDVTVNQASITQSYFTMHVKTQ
jgi:hypothetical protein